MTNVSDVVAEARRLESKDDSALEILIGLRSRAIEKDPALASRVDLELRYETGLMGSVDDLKALGRRIVNRWNRELYGIVCQGKGESDTDRAAVIKALNLGEVAVIGAVASALIGLAVPPPIAAAVAPLVVRKFIWPAKDELCVAWKEAIASEGT